MEESRKQFERWLEKYHGLKAGDLNYANMIEMYWQAWQASRAAIEIEMPEAEIVYSTATDTYGEDGCLMLPVETIARVLKDAGIKVKE